jgi:hypothetical protein
LYPEKDIFGEIYPEIYVSVANYPEADISGAIYPEIDIAFHCIVR